MPWVKDNSNAGFSEAEPWLPVAQDHLALAAFEQDKDESSILNRNRAFYAWRQAQEPLKKGDMVFLDSQDNTLVFTAAIRVRPCCVPSTLAPNRPPSP